MDVLKEIRKRKSPLVFLSRDVEKGKVEALIEAARWAPSCFNNQPWHYVMAGKADSTREAFEGALSRGNGWAKKAPYIVAVSADPKDACDTNGLPYYAYDAGLSVMSLAIEAVHQGLAVHQMAGWDEGKVKDALGIPAEHRVIVVFALGYEGDVKKLWDKLEERIKDKLARPRTRKEPKENFFFGSFGDGR